jgi:hypothetical protein
MDIQRGFRDWATYSWRYQIIDTIPARACRAKCILHLAMHVAENIGGSTATGIEFLDGNVRTGRDAQHGRCHGRDQGDRGYQDKYSAQRLIRQSPDTILHTPSSSHDNRKTP